MIFIGTTAPKSTFTILRQLQNNLNPVSHAARIKIVRLGPDDSNIAARAGRSKSYGPAQNA